jgi:hypothetical protein
VIALLSPPGSSPRTNGIATSAEGFTVKQEIIQNLTTSFFAVDWIAKLDRKLSITEFPGTLALLYALIPRAGSFCPGAW